MFPGSIRCMRPAPLPSCWMQAQCTLCIAPFVPATGEEACSTCWTRDNGIAKNRFCIQARYIMDPQLVRDFQQQHLEQPASQAQDRSTRHGSSRGEREEEPATDKEGVPERTWSPPGFQSSSLLFLWCSPPPPRLILGCQKLYLGREGSTPD